MKTTPVEGIQPSVIRWARESIGLSVDEVARRLKRKAEDIAAWEAGEQAPTYAQLEKLAYSIYKRPLAVFFLPAPPQERTPKAEFRTLPVAELDALLPDTRLHIRKGHAYQIALAELFGENPARKQICRDINLSGDEPLAHYAHQVRAYLGVDMATQSGWKEPDVALKAWRKAIEEKGVFVFKASFKQKEISGFSLAHSRFPVIYLNNSTTQTRQVFSLLHELCHLLFNENGLSQFDASYIDSLPQGIQQLERQCNALAAEILMPAADFAEQSAHLPFDIEGVGDREIEQLACRYGVSREAILRRFLDQGRVGAIYYRQKANAWAAQQKKAEGRGNWYATANTYLSPRFAAEVVSQHYRNQLTMEQASELLGVKAKNFEGLEQRILRGALA